MSLVNLTTLFTTPVSNVSYPQRAGTIGSALPTFQYEIQEGIQDYFSTNPLYENISSEAEIRHLAESNPTVMKILKEHGIPLKVNMAELEALKKGHLQNTRVLAAKICSNLK